MSYRDDSNSSDEIIRSTMSEIFLFLLFFFLIWLAFVLNDRTGYVGQQPGEPTQARDGEPDKVGLLEDIIRGLRIDLANAHSEVKGLTEALGDKEQLILVLSKEIEGQLAAADGLTASQLIVIIGNLKNENENLEGQMRDQKVIIASLRTEKGELNISLAEALYRLGQKEGEPRYPPLIPLSDADGIYFETGSAAPKAKLIAAAKTAAKTVIEYARAFDANVVDVVGHADEVAIKSGSHSTNLDSKSIDALNGNFPIGNLDYQDNVGLAMARAISFTKLLRAELDKTDEGRRLRVLPYSAGQLISPGDTIVTSQSGNADEARRRLEVRVRRFTTEE